MDAGRSWGNEGSGGRDCSFHRGERVTDSTHGLSSGQVNFGLPQRLGCCQETLRHFTDLVGFGAALLPGVGHCGEGSALHLGLFLPPVGWRPWTGD